MKNKEAIKISTKFKDRKIMKRAAASLLVPLTFFGLIGCGTSQSKASVSQPVTATSVKPVVMTTNKNDAAKKLTTVEVTTNRPVKITPVSVPILELHHSKYIKNWPWSLKPGQFASEMAWLSQHHFHSITLQQFYNAYEYGAKLPSRPIVITFDDGNADNWPMATPILKKYGYTATEFVVTAAIGKKGVLSKKDLIAMQKSGVWDIESHTVHHWYLAKLPQKKVVYELTQSKKTLEKWLGKPVQFFCYPYGSYNNKVVKDVQAAGYLLATTVHHGYGTPVASGPLTLDRLSVHAGLPLKTFASWFKPSLEQKITKHKSKLA